MEHLLVFDFKVIADEIKNAKICNCHTLENKMSYLMGIDLGTSSVKTIIMDLDGNIVGLGQENYDDAFEKYKLLYLNNKNLFEKRLI